MVQNTASLSRRFGSQADDPAIPHISLRDVVYSGPRFTDDKGTAAVVVERLAPLIPHYEKVPILNEAVAEMRAVASAKQAGPDT